MKPERWWTNTSVFTTQSDFRKGSASFPQWSTGKNWPLNHRLWGLFTCLLDRGQTKLPGLFFCVLLVSFTKSSVQDLQSTFAFPGSNRHSVRPLSRLIVNRTKSFGSSSCLNLFERDCFRIQLTRSCRRK